MCFIWENRSKKAKSKIFVARSSSAQTGKNQKVPLIQEVSTTEAQIKITTESLENLIRKRMWRGSNIYDKLGYFDAKRNKSRSPNYKIREVQYL